MKLITMIQFLQDYLFLTFHTLFNKTYIIYSPVLVLGLPITIAIKVAIKVVALKINFLESIIR